VKYMLTDPVYAGIRAEGRHAEGKFFRIESQDKVERVAQGKAKPKAITRDEPLFVTTNNHEPLVSPETFDRVQEKIESRRKTNTRPRNADYLLTGILMCGHCGGRLYGAPGGTRKKDGTYSLYYYVCGTGAKQGKGRCQKYAVRKDHIESYVLDVLHEALCSPEAVEQVRQAVHRRARTDKPQKADVRALKAKIRGMDRKIEKAAENVLLADSDSMPDLIKVLTQWREERATMQARLDQAKNPIWRSPDKLAEKAIAELTRLREHLDSADRMKVRAVVKSAVSRITLWWEPIGKRRRVSRGLLEFNSSNKDIQSSCR
jgi:site-specific DNA recombinase